MTSGLLIGTILMTALLLWMFVFNVLGALRGLVPAVAIFSSFIYAFGSFSVTVFFFIESFNGKIEFMDQVGSDTVAAFRDWMQEKGYSAKTQHNRIVTVLSLLKKNATKTTFSLASDLPDVEDEPAVPFEPETLKKLFAAMNPEEVVRYKFFLGTACRDKEVTYAAWSDIDFAKKIYQTDPVCEHIYLHRLRKTCASNWERAGVPIRTIQFMLGHKSLETTMKYLGITGMDQIGDKIDVAASAGVD